MFVSPEKQFFAFLVIFGVSQIASCAGTMESVPIMKEFLVRTYQEVENTLKEQGSVLKNEIIRYSKASEEQAISVEDGSCIKAGLIKHVRDIEALPKSTEKCLKKPKKVLFEEFIQELLTPENVSALRARLLSSFQRCLNLGIAELADVRNSFIKRVDVCLE